MFVSVESRAVDFPHSLASSSATGTVFSQRDTECSGGVFVPSRGSPVPRRVVSQRGTSTEVEEQEPRSITWVVNGDVLECVEICGGSVLPGGIFRVQLDAAALPNVEFVETVKPGKGGRAGKSNPVPASIVMFAASISGMIWRWEFVHPHAPGGSAQAHKPVSLFAMDATTYRRGVIPPNRQVHLRHFSPLNSSVVALCFTDSDSILCAPVRPGLGSVEQEEVWLQESSLVSRIFSMGGLLASSGPDYQILAVQGGLDDELDARKLVLAVCSDGAMRLWNMTTGKLISTEMGLFPATSTTTPLESVLLRGLVGGRQAHSRDFLCYGRHRGGESTFVVFSVMTGQRQVDDDEKMLVSRLMIPSPAERLGTLADALLTTQAIYGLWQRGQTRLVMRCGLSIGQAGRASCGGWQSVRTQLMEAELAEQADRYRLPEHSPAEFFLRRLFLGGRFRQQVLQDALAALQKELGYAVQEVAAGAGVALATQVYTAVHRQAEHQLLELRQARLEQLQDQEEADEEEEEVSFAALEERCWEGFLRYCIRLAAPDLGYCGLAAVPDRCPSALRSEVSVYFVTRTGLSIIRPCLPEECLSFWLRAASSASSSSSSSSSSSLAGEALTAQQLESLRVDVSQTLSQGRANAAALPASVVADVVKLLAAVRRFREGCRASSKGAVQSSTAQSEDRLLQVQTWLDLLLFDAEHGEASADVAEVGLALGGAASVEDMDVLGCSAASLPDLTTALLQEKVFGEDRHSAARSAQLAMEAQLVQDLRSLADPQAAFTALLQALHPSFAPSGTPILAGKNPSAAASLDGKHSLAAQSLRKAEQQAAAAGPVSVPALFTRVVPSSARQVVAARIALLQDLFVFSCQAQAMGALSVPGAMPPSAVLQHLLAYRVLGWFGHIAFESGSAGGQAGDGDEEDELAVQAAASLSSLSFQHGSASRKLLDAPVASSEEHLFLSSQYMAFLKERSSSVSSSISSASPLLNQETLAFLQALTIYAPAPQSSLSCAALLSPNCAVWPRLDVSRALRVGRRLQDAQQSIFVQEFFRLTGLGREQEGAWEAQELLGRSFLKLHEFQEAHRCFVQALLARCWLEPELQPRDRPLRPSGQLRQVSWPAAAELAKQVLEWCLGLMRELDDAEQHVMALDLPTTCFTALQAIQRRLLAESSAEQDPTNRTYNPDSDVMRSEEDTASLQVLEGCLDRLRTILFQKTLTLGFFGQAFAVLSSMNHPAIRVESLRRLVTVLTQKRRLQTLCQLPWSTALRQDLERTLWDKAEQTDLDLFVEEDETQEDLLRPHTRTRASSTRTGRRAGQTGHAASVPNLYWLLYALRMQRDDMRGAAEAMYRFTQRLERQSDLSDPALRRRQVHALLAVLNALSLVPQHPWLQFAEDEPAAAAAAGPTGGYTPGKRKTPSSSSSSSSSSLAAAGSPRQAVVHLLHLRRHYALSVAQLDLLELPAGAPFLPPSASAEETCSALLEAGLAERALQLASTFSLDLAPLFAELTRKCLRLQLAGGYGGVGGGPLQLDADGQALEDWALTGYANASCAAQHDAPSADTPLDLGMYFPNQLNRAHRRVGERADSEVEGAWNLLRSALLRYEPSHVAAAAGSRCKLTVAETILQFSEHMELPSWLLHLFQPAEATRPGFAGGAASPDVLALLRMMLRYGLVTQAVRLTVQSLAQQRPTQAAEQGADEWSKEGMLVPRPAAGSGLPPVRSFVGEEDSWGAPAGSSQVAQIEFYPNSSASNTSSSSLGFGGRSSASSLDSKHSKSQQAAGQDWSSTAGLLSNRFGDDGDADSGPLAMGFGADESGGGAAQADDGFGFSFGAQDAAAGFAFGGQASASAGTRGRGLEKEDAMGDSDGTSSSGSSGVKAPQQSDPWLPIDFLEELVERIVFLYKSAQEETSRSACFALYKELWSELHLHAPVGEVLLAPDQLH
eukprot:g70503.t1